MGRHVCGVSHTAEQSARMTARWILSTLEQGMRILWPTSSARSTIPWLERSGLSYESVVGAGQLLVADPAEIVGLSRPGEIPSRLERTARLVEETTAGGFAGLSVCIDASEATGVMPGVSAQLAFESAWEEFTRHHRVSMLCLYAPEADREHVRQAVVRHPREYVDPYGSARATCGGFEVGGEIDMSNSGHLRSFLEAAVAGRGDGEDVVVHLGELSFIDLSGTRHLVQLGRALAPRRVRVVGAPAVLRRILDLAGWRHDLDLVEGAA